MLNDLWIISREGIPLIELFNNTKIDSGLLGAFLSAIKSFSEEIGAGSVTHLVLGNKKLVLSPCVDGHAYLVSQTDVNVKDKKIRKIFKVLGEFFEELYSAEDIINWDGDLSLFDKFKDRIDIYFQMYDL
ncbi:MAG: hypothetical protein ACFFD7_12130 [Candidatus Thorarchaeota archaeon]